MGSEPSKHDILQDLISLSQDCKIASTESKTEQLERRMRKLEAQVRLLEARLCKETDLPDGKQEKSLSPAEAPPRQVVKAINDGKITTSDTGRARKQLHARTLRLWAVLALIAIALLFLLSVVSAF